MDLLKHSGMKSELNGELNLQHNHSRNITAIDQGKCKILDLEEFRNQCWRSKNDGLLLIPALWNHIRFFCNRDYGLNK